MSGRIRALSEGVLRALAAALRAGRLAPPYTRLAVEHLVGGPGWLTNELNALAAQGLGPAAIAWGAEALADERAAWRVRWAGVELTWTGPEELVTETRDTGAVARQLFASAERSLLVSTFALDGGAKGENLLGVLRARMGERPDLCVRLFLNLARPFEDERPTQVILEEHVRRLQRDVLTWEPRPRVFYDRRALEATYGARASLHAKVIVADDRQTLITSANLTEAAQERNIEAGVLIDDGAFAGRVVGQFERLVGRGVLKQLSFV